ncbi:hypothetical protein IRJ41_001815 [Triplophysa rosa]|uniref:Uncharacterized protein n=1 Tax=Triplophysa rosa TaxID=992332 RepID=A0A9W7X4V2_TRIRA|nr:hypothetical protein IRJ41_001815 [Triplophysa rosa]
MWTRMTGCLHSLYVGRTKVKNLAELLVLPQCCEDKRCFTSNYGPSQAQWCETTGPYQPVTPRLPTGRGNGENGVSISQSHIEERNQSQRPAASPPAVPHASLRHRRDQSSPRALRDLLQAATRYDPRYITSLGSSVSADAVPESSPPPSFFSGCSGADSVRKSPLIYTQQLQRRETLLIGCSDVDIAPAHFTCHGTRSIKTCSKVGALENRKTEGGISITRCAGVSVPGQYFTQEP